MVFGQTDSGKSSLINMLAGEGLAEVCPGVQGRTSDIQNYDIADTAGDTYRFWDTPGLNEG